MGRKKSRFVKIFFIAAATAFVAFVAVFFFVLPSLVADSLNPTAQTPPFQVSEKARNLHGKLFIADLHADSLLWNRNLTKKSRSGHVDFPRMREGNLGLQFFTVVTKSPRFLNLEINSGETDNIFWLALAQRQPLENLSSLLKRALFQAQKLHEYAAHDEKFVIIKNKRDLNQFLERRKSDLGLVAGILGIEGAHALDGRPENVEVLFEAGFRMMSPSHFFDSEMGGSVHGIEKYGLTEAGREMIRQMEEHRMLVDVAHASPKTIDSILQMANRPIVVSHTGVRGTCSNNRNLTDEQLRAIAKTGGLIGIGFWDTAICSEEAGAIAKAIRYTANVVGVEYVALGSDFDGSVKTVMDASGMVLITDALLRENFSEDEISQIMGGNVLRLLGENLPE